MSSSEAARYPLLRAVAPQPPTAGAAAASRSSVYRSSNCDASLPLASTWRGLTTCWETFAQSAAERPGDRCLGERPLINGTGEVGAYEWETYADVSRQVEALAHALVRSFGLGHGTRVAIYGTNSPSWIKAMQACSAFGGASVPLYDSLGPDAVRFILEHSKAEVVFVQDDKLPKLASAVRALQPPPGGRSGPSTAALRLAVVWRRAGAPAHLPRAPLHLQAEQELSACGVRVVPFNELLRLGAKAAEGEGEGSVGGESPPLALRRPGPEDVATIMYSSGTTGQPKGVVLTHRALVSVVASQLTFLRDPWGRAGLAATLQRLEAAARGQRRPSGGDQVPDGDGERGGRGAAPAGDAVGNGATALWDVDALPEVQAEARRWPFAFERGVDAHLSYLPLAHIYERALVEAAFAQGAAVGCWQGDVDKLQDDLRALKPAIFVGVPRVWERVQQGVMAKLAARTPIARWLYGAMFAFKVARLRLGVPMAKASWLADLLVFRKVRAALGGRLKLCISGAAPLSTQQEEFVRTALCAFAGQGYGLTETCSASFVALPDRFDMCGTVGPPQSCVEMCLESVPEMGYDATATPARGELLLRGPCTFQSYLDDGDATRAMKDAEGWVHTGDVVEITPSGALRIIDRRKHLIKLSQGEFVPVEAVETSLKGALPELLSAVWVHADPLERRLVAVVVPHRAALLAWWRNEGGAAGGGGRSAPRSAEEEWREACESAASRQYVAMRLQQASRQLHLPAFQRVAAVHLEPDEWVAGGDGDHGDGGGVVAAVLTPTHKLKRHVLRQRYERELRGLYAELRSTP